MASTVYDVRAPRNAWRTLPDAAEEMLERYYTVKVASMQFAGGAQFGMDFWSGLEALALTLPIIRWFGRAFSELPAEEATARAIRIVDHNYGYSPLLGSRRQRGKLGHPGATRRIGQADRLVQPVI